jgi:hypothetical protein
MSDLPAGFLRAESRWLQPPEDSPAFIEWYDAQEEKKQLLESASDVLDCLEFDPVDTLDELDESIDMLEHYLSELKEKRDEIAALEDEFPIEYIDECPDDGE